MSALLLGSISTIADTSELQRQAFNDAFEEHGLEWRWNRDDYLHMLDSNGGEGRIAEFAQTLDQKVDAHAVHATKSRLFQESLATSGVTARPGVVETITRAKSSGMKVALVTTTSKENITALLEALGPDIKADHFDLIVDVSNVDLPKPDKAAYVFTLQTLGESEGDCIAVEDNLGGVESATAAGVICVAFPNENTTQGEFVKAQRRVDHLDLDELQKLITNA